MNIENELMDFQPSSTTPEKTLYEILTSYISFNLVYAMARLRIADALKEKPLLVADLAGQTGTDQMTMLRICRGLVQFGFLTEHKGLFELTALGNFLCIDHPRSMYHLAILAGEQFNPAWGRLPEAARSDTTAFELEFGKSLFAYNDSRANGMNAFHAFMSGISEDLATMLLQVYDFSEVKSVMDIGGGSGTCIKHILQKYPSTRGGLLEDQGVVLLAQKNCADLIAHKRMTVISGNFLDSIPGGYDIYILSQILHDWEDATCIQILQNCRAAMNPGSKLLIITCLMPDDDHQSGFAVVSDLNMLILTGGKERTLKEYDILLREAELEVEEVIPARMEYFIIVAGAV